MTKFIIPIQNISDVITNSSSEIFICQTDNPDEVAETIKEVLTSVYDNLKKARSCSGKNTLSLYEENLDDILSISIADDDYTDASWGYSYKKGDIIIESEYDNSIPSILMDFIYEFFAWDKVTRRHLG
jgi:hypothetical protein